MLAKAELNYYPETVLEKEYKEQVVRPDRRPKLRRRNNTNSLLKVICFISAIILMVTSLFILLRYANITKMRMNVTELESQKVELEKVKMNLIADLEGVKNSLKIGEDAIYKLGMSYPQEGQIVYVSVGDLGEEVHSDSNISLQIDKVLNMFSSLF